MRDATTAPPVLLSPTTTPALPLDGPGGAVVAGGPSATIQLTPKVDSPPPTGVDRPAWFVLATERPRRPAAVCRLALTNPQPQPPFAASPEPVAVPPVPSPPCPPQRRRALRRLAAVGIWLVAI